MMLVIMVWVMVSSPWLVIVWDGCYLLHHSIDQRDVSRLVVSTLHTHHASTRAPTLDTVANDIPCITVPPVAWSVSMYPLE